MSDLVASGGLCTPATHYPIPNENARPIRDAFIRLMDEARLPMLEWVILKLGRGEWVTIGRADVAVLVAETSEERWSWGEDEVVGHEWDEPVRLRYAR